jgi:cbb3-type cytochrome oxidase subunit 3
MATQLFIAFTIFMAVFSVGVLIWLFVSGIKWRRRQREFEKRMLKLGNERRALFGLPPMKRWDE